MQIVSWSVIQLKYTNFDTNLYYYPQNGITAMQISVLC